MALQTANKNISFNSFKFEKEGDTLKGYYQGQTKKQINDKPAIEHTYLTKSGLVSVLGQANIIMQIANNNIVRGSYMEITFTGETLRTKRGGMVKIYDIVFDLDDVSLSGTSNEEALFEDDAESDTAAAASVAATPVAPRIAAKPVDAARAAKIQAALNSKSKVLS